MQSSKPSDCNRGSSSTIKPGRCHNAYSPEDNKFYVFRDGKIVCEVASVCSRRSEETNGMDGSDRSEDVDGEKRVVRAVMKAYAYLGCPPKERWLRMIESGALDPHPLVTYAAVDKYCPTHPILKFRDSDMDAADNIMYA